jgi:hypothetical protein
MKTRNVFLSAFIVFVAGCAPSVRVHISKAYPALKPGDNVRVIEVQESVPGNAESIGQVAIAEKKSSNCSYNIVLELAKEQARTAGGNALKIVEHTHPDAAGKCHSISADILRIDATKDSTVARPSETKTGNSSSPATRKPYMQPLAKDWHPRLAVNGGWSWRTAKIPADANGFEQAYIRDLKSGSAYNGDIEYYFGDYYGAGFKYGVFKSSASVMASAQVSPGVYVNGLLSDDISIVFIGPKFCMRVPSETKNSAFLAGLSIGYLGYTDKGGFGSATGNITGSTVGMVYEIGYDIGLSKHLAAGFNFALTMGTLTQYDATIAGNHQHVKLAENQYEGLGHFDIGLGLRLR